MAAALAGAMGKVWQLGAKMGEKYDDHDEHDDLKNRDRHSRKACGSNTLGLNDDHDTLFPMSLKF
jgi:hypothetical protein